jgi:hypothetical protein
MRNILYWSFLILISILLAYATPFGLYHLVFLGGALVIFVGYFGFLSIRRKASGVWEHDRYRVSIFGVLLVWVVVYWTTIGLFSNAKELREFRARYEPYVQQGTPEGYVFYYVDYPGAYERIDSPELNKLIQEKRPEQVRMVLEIVRDFGRLRAYTVRSVESISVDKAWTEGNPPWQALREARE